MLRLDENLYALKRSFTNMVVSTLHFLNVFIGVCLICSAVLFISALKIIKLQENSILRTPGLVVTKISATIIFRVRSTN